MSLYIRLLPRQVKEGVNSDSSSLVQSSLQGVEALCERKVKRQSFHSQHTSGIFK